MQVLFTSNYNSSNIYLKTIVEPLKSMCQVVCCIDAFWHSNIKFDIVHIQWPEELFYWESITDADINRCIGRIEYWKKEVGAKIIITRHNEYPHRNEILDKKLYDYLYDIASNKVIHLGEYSASYLGNLVKNVVIFHPNYSSLCIYNKDKARDLLGLDKNANFFLSLGAIRKIEEEKDLIKAFLNIKLPNTRLLLCNSIFEKEYPSKKYPLKWLRFQVRRYMLRKKGVLLCGVGIDDHKLELLLSAADVAVVPRIDSLNSGLVFLGFTFGKVVVGPSINNIKEWLAVNNNPVFIPKNRQSFVNALRESLTLVAGELGERNKKLAYSDGSPFQIARLHFELYSKCYS